jgi:hypothetical protein
MTYHVQFRWGDSEPDAPVERMREALSELDVEDLEHPDAWLTHESGWTLSVFSSGLVVWDNLAEPGASQHQNGISRDRALELWQTLSRGDIAAIEREPWSPGYGKG